MRRVHGARGREREMTEVMYDYGDDAVAAPSGDNSLGMLRSLAGEQRALEQDVARLERELVEAKERLRQVSEVRLPEAMEELGVPEFSTIDGLRIKIKEVVRASMGSGELEKSRALDWLEQNGHGKLIKRVLEVPFGSGQDQYDRARGLQADLLDKGLHASFERKVESSTLRAFVTEMLAQGRDIPLDVFKVLRQRRAQIEIGN